MEISLTPALEQFVKRQVDSGHYSSAAEVVLTAMQFFEEHEQIYKGRFDELRREVMVGYEAAERGELIDGETVFENLRAKLAKRRVQAGE
ncbi:MAG: type II toxin-antitoxin system ParD family antitoxin [Thermosynechococcaceae cyanobacterium]